MPGERVDVDVTPLDDGVDITGCAVAFAATPRTACRLSGARWTAGVDVPADADPGDVPLRWTVTYRTAATGAAGGDDGTVDYRVRAPATLAAPVFSVTAEPPAARAGERLTVTPASLAEGVTVTGCGAGFAADAMVECRRTPQGWAADLVVPPDARPGSATVVWRLAYQRAGGTGASTTNGLLSFTVLPPTATPAAGGLNLPAIVGRVLLGVLAFAAFLAVPRVRTWLQKLIKGSRPPEPVDEGTDPASIDIVPMPRLDRMTAQAENPNVPPDELIRIRTHQPDLAPRHHEEVP